ncbi:unnamed protein product, partial [Ectocarpus sp. 12 AP-2014]
TTRTGRLGDAPVPVMAVGVARKEAVGPRGERPEVAAEMDREDEGEEGSVLVLDVPDDVTTRGRRRIPGGVLSHAPRWTSEKEGAKRAGEVLDIKPEAGRDVV